MIMFSFLMYKNDRVFVLYFVSVERTEKVPLGSIKKIVSEPIKGHEEYHIMVR